MQTGSFSEMFNRRENEPNCRVCNKLLLGVKTQTIRNSTPLALFSRTKDNLFMTAFN